MSRCLLLLLAMWSVATEGNRDDHSRIRYCDNMLSCLNRDLYVTVVDIVSHGMYKLTDNLVLERLPSVNTTSTSDVATPPPDAAVLREMNGVTTLVLMRKTMDIFNTHALRLQLLRDLDLALYKEAGHHGTPRLAVALEANINQRGGRTFGLMRRRIAFVLLAIMFKLGLMTAMLMMLIVLTVKGLKLGVLLLALTFANYSGKALPILPFPSLRPMDEIQSSVPPMHIHVHKDVSAPEWQPGPGPGAYGPTYPEDPGGPYPYPASQSRLTQAQLQLDIPLQQYPSMRKTNPGYYRNPPDNTRSTANTHGYSVYYQKKNGQFFPVVINDAHRQTMDTYDMDEEHSYPSMYRAKRRRDDDVDVKDDSYSVRQ